MKVLVTGSSGDRVKAIVKRFVASGHQVVGMDKQGSPFTLDGYTHITADLTASLPDMDGLEVIVACHGVQLPDEETIEVNLSSTKIAIVLITHCGSSTINENMFIINIRSDLFL